MLDSIYLEVEVLQVVECDGIGVVVGRVSLLQTLLNVCDSPAGAADVDDKDDENDRLDPGLMEPPADPIPEEDHAHMLLVVQGIVRILGVDPARHEPAVEEVPLAGLDEKKVDCQFNFFYPPAKPTSQMNGRQNRGKRKYC